MRVLWENWWIWLGAWVLFQRAASRSANTIRLRRYWVERLVEDLRDRCPDPRSVTMDDLVEWLANPAWSSETRKSARASVVGFYRWAVDSGRIAEDANPARKLPPVSVEAALPRPAPDAVFQQALWFADDKQELMLMLAGYAGLRRAEIACVHMRDFDWEAGELLVHGKGRKERRVPIHPELARAVRASIERRSRGEVGRGFRLYVEGIGPDSYLFPGKHGHMSPDTVGRILERLLAGPWTGHTLRHRFATKAYAPERDIRAVQELLGHSKPETTARYVQAPADAKRSAVLAVGMNVRRPQDGSPAPPGLTDPAEAA